MKLNLGIAACFFAPDPDRNIFRGKRLGYFEEQTIQYAQSRGDLAWLIPTRPNSGASLAEYVNRLDGLMLQGGSDVAPESYGEKPLRPEWGGDQYRDDYEMEIIAGFRKAKKPIFGICRGMQILNVALGGTLYQDIGTQIPEAKVHRDGEKYDKLFHTIKFEPGTRLEEIYQGQNGRKINTIHHQAIKDLAPGWTIEARSKDDDIIEAVRLDGSEWISAVQWHPEFLDQDDQSIVDPIILFDDFREACLRAKNRG